MAGPDTASGIYAFGPFRLDTARRALCRDGVPIALTPRMFDLLLCLVAQNGRVVDRRELMRAIWGARVVDEANLKQTVYELRKALGDFAAERLIVTEPMRGYRLALPVTRMEPAAAAAAEAAWAPLRRGAWPALAGGFGLVCLGLVAWRGLHGTDRVAAGFVPPAHSVAVLPFANGTRDPQQDDFADGLSDELINQLGRIEGLHVAARTSSFLFRDRARPVPEIARLLNVGAVLEGSVRRDGGHVHITAELIDAASGFAVWSRSYDSNNGDVLDAQAGIAEAVAGSMQVALLDPQKSSVGLGGTRNPAAYDAYLRGMKLERGADDVATLEAAQAAFASAIAIDPDFAVAHAHRARAMAFAAEETAQITPAGVQLRLAAARREADRALAIAPRLGVAHLALSDILCEYQDFAGAQREMALARADAPSDMQILSDDVFLEVALGHTREALETAEQGVGIDPLAPSAHSALAYAQRAVHDFDGAMASLERARRLGAGGETAFMEALVAMERGDNQAARSACARGTDWRSYLCLAIVEHRLGMNDEALFHMAALRAALGASGAFQYAEVYAQWRQKDQAVKWLETAYRSRDPGLLNIKCDALLDPIRDTPQYATIERRMNFPP